MAGFNVDWNRATPSGSAPANTVHTELRNLEWAVEERMNALLGITDWDTQNDDAGIEIARLLLKKIAASYIVGGSTSLAFRNNANNANNVLIEDDGDVTLRKDLAIIGKIVAALVIDHNLTHNAGFLATFKSRISVEDTQAGIKRKHKGNATGAVTIDWNESNNQAFDMVGNATFSQTNMQAGSWYVLELKQDAIGGRTGLFTGVEWSDGAAPILTTVNGRTDFLTFYYNGTTIAGFVVGQNHNV